MRQALILAGGLGTRLRPVTQKIPKTLMPVGERFFLHYLLTMLAANGVRDVLLLVGHLGEQVVEAVGDGARYGCRIAYSVEPELLGTGGAIKHAAAQVHDEFFVLNGDTYLPLDYRALERRWDQRRDALDGLLVVYDNRERVAPGNVRLDDGELVAEYRKHADAKGGYVDAGVQVFKKMILDLIPDGRVVSLEQEVFPKLIAERRLGAYPTSTRYYDIGTPERLAGFERYVARHAPDEQGAAP
jgi:NDP-sugar pyrophosphorylase family protein